MRRPARPKAFSTASAPRPAVPGAGRPQHVIDIIDAAYRPATTGAAQRLTPTVDGLTAA
jgi:hypothetical protein